MKLILVSLFALLLSVPAFADQVIWSCAYNGNPNALTISLIEPTSGSAGIVGNINDRGLLQALNLFGGQMYGTGSRTEDLEHNNLNLIYGEDVNGFQFNHVNGGIDVVPGWTDHTPPDYHTNDANHVFFAYGECVYYPVNN
jgi:hypothetical protein